MDNNAMIFVFILALSSSQARTEIYYDDDTPAKYDKVTTTERWNWGFVQPQFQPQVQTPVKQQVKPQVRPQVRPQVKPQVQPQVQPKVQPKVKPQVKPQVQPQILPYNFTRLIIETPAPQRADPCVAGVPWKQNFREPGRRISQIKCYEYIWEQKLRHDDDKRFEACIEKLRKSPDGDKFAIGGRSTVTGEFPHMGAIGWKASIGTWIFKCGSTLISPKFVLTAAHCSSASKRDTTIEDPVPKIVRLGDKNILDVFNNGVYPTDVKISKIIVHPQYAAPKQYYDIALMELQKTVEFTKTIQPACLWNNFDTSSLGKKATLTGWGVVDTASKTTSPELQAAVVDVIDSETCDRLLKSSQNRNWCGVQEHQICGGKLAGGVDACQGDSGGPLQVKIDIPIEKQGTMHYIIGVTSFGKGCGLPNLPGIYTRVSSFLDWIEPIVWR